MSSIAIHGSVTSFDSVQSVSTRGFRAHFAKISAATIVASALANVIVYYAGDAIIGYNPDFIELGNSWGIAMMTAIPALIAALLYAGLVRWTDKPVRNFVATSAVVFVLSLIPDFTMIPSEPGTSNAQLFVLCFMHLVAAVVITFGLTRYIKLGER